MAKKTASDNSNSAAPRRAPARRDKGAGAGEALSTTAAPPTATASDTPSGGGANASAQPGSGGAIGSAEPGGGPPQPSPDEIAQAAYLRYLNRGAGDGRDFDDWIEAERELSQRNGTQR